MKCSACGTDKTPSNGKNKLTVPQTKKRKSEDTIEKPGTNDKKQKIESNEMLKTTKSVGNFTFTFKSKVSTSKSTINNESTVLKSVTIGSSQNNKSNTNQGVVNGDNQPQELCKGHKKPCVKKTVSKEGPNKLRLFWTCSLPKAKSCDHFSWADLHHPKCKHGEISLLREVYKMNENNGREFFICPRPKASQCDFFQWNDI